MSTSTDLVPVDMTQLPSTQVGSDETFNELAKSGDFLGRLQLFTKGKAIDKGLIRPGPFSSRFVCCASSVPMPPTPEP